MARTRWGREHTLVPSNPELRRARYWERIVYGGRFPMLPLEPAAAKPEHD